MIYIIGHKNPDTDSVVSAIALAEFYNFLDKMAESAVAGELNKETKYILEKFGFDQPKTISKDEKKVVLVDHNEPSQISEKINHEEIIEIVDHHKLGGLVTVEPISINIKPLGSTATVITIMFKENDFTISKKLASILLAGIISDTLNFTSPTTTNEDKIYAKILNEIATVDTDDLAQNMFKAKSDLTGVPISELISKDYKEFQMGKYKVGIGVFETVDSSHALGMREELFKSMPETKAAKKIDFLFFGVVDILNQKTYVFVDDEEESKVISEAFGVHAKEGIFILNGIVSRKKQIIPPLEKYFEGI